MQLKCSQNAGKIQSECLQIEKFSVLFFQFFQEFKDGFNYFARQYLQKNRDQPFYFVNDIWVNMPAAFVLPKYSPMTQKMNNFIMKMVDFGIISKIFRDYTQTQDDISNLNRISGENYLSKLGLYHFLGLFTFYLLISVFAIITFIWELNFPGKKQN